MSGFPGRTGLDDREAQAQEPAHLEFHFACLGGTDGVSLSARRVRRIIVWSLGVCLIGVAVFILFPPIVSVERRDYDLGPIQSMRAIAQAELIYQSMYPANGYACSLAALSGDPASGPASPIAAQIIQGNLVTGAKNGYIFTIGNCTKERINGTERITGYRITAVPRVVGKTGQRGFCSDQFGTIKVDPRGGTNCIQLLQ
jgi:type IV pilus assembly protein PilA